MQLVSYLICKTRKRKMIKENKNPAFFVIHENRICYSETNLSLHVMFLISTDDPTMTKTQQDNCYMAPHGANHTTGFTTYWLVVNLWNLIFLKLIFEHYPKVYLTPEACATNHLIFRLTLSHKDGQACPYHL
jgi:hypothetical protein